MKWLELSTCDSTQRDLRARWDADPTLTSFGIFTLNQTAGHGRRGSDWESPKGNLAFSVILDDSFSRPTLWPLISALALIQTIHHIDPNVSLNLKWPNDIYSHGKKLAGVLVDRVGGDVSHKVLIGIGLNIVAAPTQLAYGATSLKELSAVSFEPKALVHAWFRMITKLTNVEVAATVQAAESIHMPPLGSMVRIEDSDITVSGRLHGIGDFGELVIDTTGGRRSFTSGSLRFDDRGKS
jgi:BirA family transcriptional regulator, biotin operon repressor / biotin---[acetyl-CoA-carboxylase] ligase